MIQLREAVEKAKQFIIEINGEQEDLQLEYIKHLEPGNIWRITYSFYREESAPPNQLQSVLGISGNGKRIYRTIDIEDQSGEIVGMQMGTAHEVESV